jgi:ribosomal protein S27AE
MKTYDISMHELNVKRLYLDAKHKSKCPRCGHKVTKDFTDDYLSYPAVGKSEDVYMYCGRCEHEWVIKATLKMSLEIEESK